MVTSRSIKVFGASQHNLKSVNLEIPKDSLVVFCGVSGSGKSSLAFDTLFAEGQRRYVESLSAYARQFLGQIERPDFERITGLAPTVAIQQKSASSNPRSTVGTVTEVLDYLRVLFARLGHQRCHVCGRDVGRQTAQEMVRTLLAFPEGTEIWLMAPVVTQRKGEHREVFADLISKGFVRFLVDGQIRKLDAPPDDLDKKIKHEVSVIVDRVKIKEGLTARLTDSLETCLKAGDGLLTARVEGRDMFFSEKLYCAHCDLSLPEPTPQLFSFNNPQGACQVCHGLGTRLEVDPDKVIPDPSLSVEDGAISFFSSWRSGADSWTQEFMRKMALGWGIDLSAPFESLPKEHQHILLYGIDQGLESKELRRGMGDVQLRYEGVCNTIMRRFHETQSDGARRYYQLFFSNKPCSTCLGSRLRPEAHSVFISDMNIAQMTSMTVSRLLATLNRIELPDHEAEIARAPLRESTARLKFLEDVGLGYISLERSADSLSGGEAQRIRLASQLGTELTGVIYVLDEPSIGLHPRDNRRLVETLKSLRDMGNTVVVVEHDRETIEAADHIVDFGPGAGIEGGEVVYSGPVAGIYDAPRSLTGQYLSGRKTLEERPTRRSASGHLKLRGACHNNLKSVDLDFPLGTFCVVTGVSGAGKSSLIAETLKPAIFNIFKLSTGTDPGKFTSLTGHELLDKVVSIDQKPIGRTPRSNPSTYTKVFDLIRNLFAETREAKTYGYGPARFSFNVKGGRCERCQGAGSLKVEMHFLPDVFVTCPECGGRRFNDATLRVRYKGKDISEVLEMSVSEALTFFDSFTNICRILQTLQDVGLGYIQLGQPSTTLSGGEAQRIKLSRELARRDTGNTLYLMDEPSTGLHFDDVAKLLRVINELVDRGNSVLVVEHNLDIIKSADHVIDLGPEGGEAGGHVIAQGTPEQVAQVDSSFTGRFLRDAE